MNVKKYQDWNEILKNPRSVRLINQTKYFDELQTERRPATEMHQLLLH